MKKIIAQLVVLVLFVSASAFAGNINSNVNKNIQTAFTEKFNGAKEVRWSTTDNYVKANFQLDGQFMAAYYNNEGELLGVTRNLLSNQLPINLQAELKKNLAGGWITELFEYATERETIYFATIENADQKILLKSVDSHTWMTSKKTKKN